MKEIKFKKLVIDYYYMKMMSFKDLECYDPMMHQVDVWEDPLFALYKYSIEQCLYKIRNLINMKGK